MASVINTNISSLNTQRSLSASQGSLTTAIQRLSSGLRVNSAKDDAAGLAIAERMNAQIRGLNVAARNANDGISVAQTAEGALGKIGDMVQRVRELAVQSANASNSATDRSALNKEAQALISEIDRVASSTKFGDKQLLTSNSTAIGDYQVGAGNGSADRINFGAIVDAQKGGLGGTATTARLEDIVLTGATAAQTAIGIADAALEQINSARASLGAMQSRFESAIGNIQIMGENLSAARSRIVDADFAQETATMTRAQILQQAGTAMLSQANQLPQQVLSLLR